MKGIVALLLSCEKMVEESTRMQGKKKRKKRKKRDKQCGVFVRRVMTVDLYSDSGWEVVSRSESV